MDEEEHNLDATVFVFRERANRRIVATYVDRARGLEKDPDYEHIATLEPRLFIQAHYDEVEP